MTEEDKTVLELIKGLLANESPLDFDLNEALLQSFQIPSQETALPMENDKILHLEAKLIELSERLENSSSSTLVEELREQFAVKINSFEQKLEAQTKLFELYHQDFRYFNQNHLEQATVFLNQKNELLSFQEQIKNFEKQLENLFQQINTNDAKLSETSFIEQNSKLEVLGQQVASNEKYMRYFLKTLRSFEAQKENTYLKLQQIDELQAKFTDFENQFDAVDFSNLLPSENIVLPAQLAESNQKIAELYAQVAHLQEDTNQIRNKQESQLMPDLEKTLATINEKIQTTDKQTANFSEDIAQLQKNFDAFVQKEQETLQQLINQQAQTTKDLEEKEKHWQMQIDANMANLMEKMNHQFDILQNQSSQSMQLMGQMQLSSERFFKGLFNNMNQFQEKENFLMQKMEDLQAQISNISAHSLPKEIPTQAVQTEKSLVKINTTAQSALQLGHLEALQGVLFKDESYLQTFFPKSFFIAPPNTQIPNTFYWLKEKIGLTYLGLVHCQTPKDSFLPVLLQLLINNLINESKLLDLEIFFQELHKRLLQAVGQFDEEKIHCGAIVLDRMNATIYFMGFGVSLWNGQKNVRKIESSSDTFEQINFKNTKIKKHTIPTPKDCRFYLVSQAEEMDATLEITLNNLASESFLQQKQILKEFFQSQDKPQTLMLGFGI